jgi:hypothetical protein
VGAWQLVRRREDRAVGFLTSSLAAVAAGTALVSRAPDSYVFYLPLYAIVTLWIALGAEVVLAQAGARGWGRRATVLLVAALVLVPAAYAAAPRVAGAFATRVLPVRDLPYRRGAEFFLYPPKSGYFGARRYATEVLTGVLPAAIILADWTPEQPLRFVQEIDGLRPDVEIASLPVEADEQVTMAQVQSHLRPVYLADDNRYYALEALRRQFRITAEGHVWRLEPLDE